MAEPLVVQTLGQLGFSFNESRAYHALLLESPSTGYEVGARAKIPRSAVYGVLRRLVQAGLARAVAQRPERFAPVPVDHVVGLLRKRFDSSAKEFEESVKTLDVTPSVPDAFSVRGYTRVLEEAERMIHNAKSTLVISGWPREINELLAEIDKATKRKVFLVVFSHAKLPKMKGSIFSYELEESALEAFWKHRLTVVADDSRTLIASTEKSEHDHAVISETVSLAEVATSQIALDITLLSQRTHQDIEKVMARMLGERVGRLDTLLSR
jgi:sugar-specific transcriptional regulator TrmB